MEAQVKYKFFLENLDCAGCAGKIESDLSDEEFVTLAALNFASKQLVIKSSRPMLEEDVRLKVDLIVKKYEKDVTVLTHKASKNKSAASVSKEARVELLAKISLGLGSLLFVIGLVSSYALHWGTGVEIGLFIMAYLLIGSEVLVSAARNILRGSWFDEQFLMTIATFSAWGIGEYPEAVAVMLFYRVGELFEAYAVNKSRRTIEGLMDIKENTTHLVDEFLQVIDVDTDFVKVGSLILVRPGERIPLDGVIEEGQSNLDVSALTGESVPVEAQIGDSVFSGAINQNSVLKIRTTADFENSMVGKILDLIENAGGRKAETEKFITKFAKYYTPVVVFTAVAMATVAPFFTGMNFGEWFYRASIFLVVSCPCALVISVPLGYFGGIGKASKYGILVKGGNYLEALTRIDTVLLDKTGTITEGKFSVATVKLSEGVSEAAFFEVAMGLEILSNHPIAKSVVKYGAGKGMQAKAVLNYEEMAGKGVSGLFEGDQVYAGSEKLLADLKMNIPKIDEHGSVVFVIRKTQLLGYLVVTDAVKASSVEAIKRLKALGIKEVIMLTGDKKAVGEQVAKIVGVDQVYTELLPHEKVAKIEEARLKAKGVVFVGDGLNDAPALALADVGVAMGGMGADLSIEAADVVLMNDDLMKLSEAIHIAKGTQRIIVQNIVFALSVKAVVLMLGAIGIATMWEAVFADVGVALLAIMNSMRNNA